MAIAIATRMPCAEPRPALGHEHRREADHRGDRQIDAADEQDQHLPGDDHAEDPGHAAGVANAVLGEEAGFDGRGDHEERDQHEQRAVVGEQPADPAQRPHAARDDRSLSTNTIVLPSRLSPGGKRLPIVYTASCPGVKHGDPSATASRSATGCSTER